MKKPYHKLAMAILGIALYSCNQNEVTTNTPLAPFTIYQPVVADTALEFTYVADISAQKHIELKPKVSGFVLNYYVDEGQQVRQNQLILRLNNEEFEQHLLKAKANMKGADAELQAKCLAFEKTEELFDRKIVSETEFAVAKAEKDAAVAQLALTETEVRNALLSLSYTEIRAPFDGFINKLNFKAGSLVSENDVLTTVSKTDYIYVYFSVSEKEFLELSKNDEIYNTPVSLILADGSKYPHEGTVETVEGTIDRVTGSISFRAIFPNKDFILKHGGSGRVSIPRSLENAFLIAQKSTFEIQDKVFVFTVDQAGVVHQKAVEIDKRLPKLYSLKSGLAPSERVLFEGVQLIKAGDTIPVQQGKLFDLIQR